MSVFHRQYRTPRKKCFFGFRHIQHGLFVRVLRQPLKLYTRDVHEPEFTVRMTGQRLLRTDPNAVNGFLRVVGAT